MLLFIKLFIHSFTSPFTSAFTSSHCWNTPGRKRFGYRTDESMTFAVTTLHFQDEDETSRLVRAVQIRSVCTDGRISCRELASEMANYALTRTDVKPFTHSFTRRQISRRVSSSSSLPISSRHVNKTKTTAWHRRTEIRTFCVTVY